MYAAMPLARLLSEFRNAHEDWCLLNTAHKSQKDAEPINLN